MVRVRVERGDGKEDGRYGRASVGVPIEVVSKVYRRVQGEVLRMGLVG